MRSTSSTTAENDLPLRVFESIVIVSPFADGVYWYLRAALRWRAFDGTVISVPAGFVTDFASVPRPLWSILPKWEKYGPAAVVHDFLYWDQRRSRKQADRYILEAMKDSRVAFLKRWIIYGAVRAFGWFSWWSDRNDKVHGGFREIPTDRFPTDPSETWKACQKRIKGDRR